MKLDSYLFTNTGGRGCNEDAVGSLAIPEGGLFVVADGLGGHVHSEQAAETVIRVLTGEEPPEDAGPDWLAERIDLANEQVQELQQQTSSNMKSTVVALLIRGDTAHWANVGDSRLYYFHQGELAEVTEDHSVAYKKYRAGEITRWEIGSDPDQSSLLRSLGNAQRHQPDCHTAEAPLEPGDGFVLCSDGLWEYVPDGEILVDYLKAETAEEWAKLLLLRAIDRIQSGNDNLSLITVMVS